MTHQELEDHQQQMIMHPDATQVMTGSKLMLPRDDTVLHEDNHLSRHAQDGLLDAPSAMIRNDSCHQNSGKEKTRKCLTPKADHWQQTNCEQILTINQEAGADCQTPALQLEAQSSPIEPVSRRECPLNEIEVAVTSITHTTSKTFTFVIGSF